MTNHFDSIADIYDKVWHFSAQYQTLMLENITGLLELDKDDSLADLGGGTGAYTRLIHATAGLRQAYCIEPSKAMYLEACKVAGIEARCADAEGFMEMDLPFTKVLLKEAIHHIPARENLWCHLRNKLPANGRILIVTRPQDIALPLFEAAKEAFRRKQPHRETLLRELETCGFETSIKTHPFRFFLDKNTWFDMIRSRFMSDLAGFTEAEIEAGITEIDAHYPGTELEIPDTILYIVASLPR